MSGTDKKCNFFNKGWLEFTGRKLEQEIGNGWAEGVHPEDYDRCIEIYTSSFDKREEFYMEYRLKRFDGEYRWISDSAAPRFSNDRTFEGYIGACMDIHEQVTSRQKLKEDEEKLNIIIEASDIGILEWDIVAKDFRYSAKYLEIFGYDPSAKVSHQDMLDQIHPDDMPIREQAFKSAVLSGKINYTVRFILLDGSIRWIEAKGKMFLNDENVPLKIIGTVRDLTEEKNRQQELVESEQKFRLLASVDLDH
jgi:PAS domain S-box-containing protein